MHKLSQNDILRMAQIIREETGNQVQENNHSMIESRMGSRLIKLKIQSMEEYWGFFAEHEREEREVLKSLMTTHYTFFFREWAHFEVLEKWLSENSTRLKERYAKNKEEVKIWVAACSRGQEMYSLAMFVDKIFSQKTGVPFQIIGSDIDAESVAFAKNGVYPLKEVNMIPREFVGGYWKRGSGPVKDFAAVDPKLKKNLSFETLNLLEVDAWKHSKNFDVIFCRNVFIYFAEASVQKIALSLAKRLDPHGLLVSGLSEPLRFPEWKMNPVGPSCYQWPQAKAAGATATLPSPRHETAKVAESPVSVLSLASKKYHVLCVDDSPVIQTLIKKIFAMDKDCGRVDIAGDGQEARQKLDSFKYDLVTLDIHMPKVTGIEFLERLYKKRSDPPVIMVSSVNRGDLDLATRSLSLGAFDYVEKPAMNTMAKSAEELLTKAKMALRKTKDSDITQPTDETEGFDKSIAQKIVVPDASQCCRVVTASSKSLTQLEQIIRGQKAEYRSPAMLILWPDSEGMAKLQSDLLNWTEAKVVSLKEMTPLLKPNHIYTLDASQFNQCLSQNKARTLSFQVLESSYLGRPSFPSSQKVQILLDEATGLSKEIFESQSGLRLSDMSPATSFASLSLEYFAELRKAAA